MTVRGGPILVRVEDERHQRMIKHALLEHGIHFDTLIKWFLDEYLDPKLRQLDLEKKMK